MIDFTRLELLVGREALLRLQSMRVCLFGVGGVGSWCAESLVRSGIGHLTIVDFDDVATSNINRQLPATTHTIGQPKVSVMEQRLKEINPEAEIIALNQKYNAQSDMDFNQYDYVIDCIDSLDDKAILLHRASASSARVFSSMGAARKIDPQQIAVQELWKVRDCPLGHALRKHLRQNNLEIKQKIQCVYSPELLDNKGREKLIDDGKLDPTSRVNGTVAHVTAIFGFTLAGLVVQDIINSQQSSGRH